VLVVKTITISLLGPLDVRLDDQPITHFEYAKVRALLAYLAVEAHRPCPRGELAALLWPEQPERTARGSLSQAVLATRYIRAILRHVWWGMPTQANIIRSAKEVSLTRLCPNPTRMR